MESELAFSLQGSQRVFGRNDFRKCPGGRVQVQIYRTQKSGTIIKSKEPASVYGGGQRQNEPQRNTTSEPRKMKPECPRQLTGTEWQELNYFILATTSCLVGDEGLVFKARHGRAKGISSTWMGKALRCSQSGSGVNTLGAGERKESRQQCA